MLTKFLRNESKEWNPRIPTIVVSFVEEMPVGFMNVRRNKELRLIDLCDDETALIDEIGAYVKEGYRGRGIGASLLSKCIEWCRLNNLVRVHVDFESANILGRPFWLGFFKETMRSVRRVVYSDLEPNK